MNLGRVLQLVLLAALFSDVVQADVKASALTRRYDDGQTQVTSPHADASATFWNDQATVGAGYAMDIVSSASSDVRSFASKEKLIHDTRREESVNLGLQITGGSLGWGYIQSDENDYHSKLFSIHATREFFEKNTVIDLGFAYGDDHIQSSSDQNFNQPMTNEAYSLGVTQIFSKISMGQLLYDLRIENGFLSSPYRKARILQPDGSVIGFPENHPNTRNRNSLAFKYNYFFSTVKLSLANSVRLYIDSWDVKSGTLEERLSRELGKRWSLAFNFRYYQQSSANFYQDKYSGTLGPFYTGNKTLASYNSLTVGLRPTFKIAEGFDAWAKAEYYVQKFENHTDVGVISDPSDDKLLVLRAQIIGAGLDAQF